MQQRLYHGSRKHFPIGFTLAPQADGYVQEQAELSGLEQLFESRRPADKTARSRSVFLVADPDLIDAAGGYNDAVYLVNPQSTPEQSDLSWYSEAFVEMDKEPLSMARVLECIDHYWSGEPFPVAERRCPEYRVTQAIVLELAELNVEIEDLEQVPAPPSDYSRWPDLLPDAQSIAEYISSQTPYEICEEQIEEQYFGSAARLQWVALSSISLENQEHHEIDPKRQAKCDKSNVETMPPFLVEDGVMQDGHHRIRTLLAKGITHHWVYVVEEAPEPELASPTASRWDKVYDLGGPGR
jgi:hypothetical protein